MINGVPLANGGTKKNRRDLDFYPTPPEVTIALMQFMQLDPCTIIEPACGDMAMVNVIKEYGHNVIASDIITGTDYLTTPMSGDAIITNPPFGLSQKFIEKAVIEAPIVAMLLKSQYWHAKSRFDLFNRCVPSYILPLTWRPDFLFNTRQLGHKAAPTMEVLWTVWIRGNTQSKYIPLKKPINPACACVDLFTDN